MKTTWKRAASILIALLMAGSLAACGGNGQSSGSQTESSSPSSTASEETVSDVSSEEASQEETAGDGDVVTLNVWGFGYTSTTDDCNAVAEAVSEITRDKIGVEITLVRQGDGEMLNLALAAGEEYDLVNYHTYSGGLTALVTNQMATPIDDLVDEYGQDAMTVIDGLGSDILETCRVNGVLYSLPNMKEISCGYGVAMRKDLLDEMGIDPATIEGWDGIHDVLVQAKEAYPDMYPVVPAWAQGGMQKTFAFDCLGTGFWDACGVLENALTNNTTVVNLYETESYKNFVEMMYQWNQEGLLMADATTTTENSLMKGGMGFSTFENSFPGKENDLSRSWGYDAVIIPTVDSFVNSEAGGSSYFIPYSSKHPEEAMKLWNLMYTDSEVSTLLVDGIEGVNWEYTDDSKSAIRNLENNTYDYIGWSWPNSWITPVFEGYEADMYDNLRTFCHDSVRSPALGFRFDSTGVQNQLTACGNVIAQYDTALRWGTIDPATDLDQFNADLKSAGIDEIIQAKQEQLDAYLAG